MNAKEKGNSFERKVSKDLSKWISYNERDDLFWRTQNSGGRFTTRMKKGVDTLNQSGDISSSFGETFWFSNFFSVECKAYKDINLWSFFTSSNVGLQSFWNQANIDSKASNKNPLLVVKQNFKPTILLTNEITSQIFSSFIFFPKIIVNYDLSNPCFAFLYDEFLEKIDPKKLKEAING